MFFFLAILFFVSGLLSISSTRRSVTAFMALLILCPLGASASFWVMKYGLYVFDFYFLSLFFVMALSGSRFLFSPDKGFFVVFLVWVWYAIVSLYFVDFSKYFLKDLRPVITVVELIVLSLFFRGGNLKVNYSVISILTIFAGLLSVVKLSLLSGGAFGELDEFYEVNSYRYLDAATYWCCVYVIARFVGVVPGGRLSNVAFLLGVVCILVSNSRFLLLAVVSAIAVVSISNVRKFLVILVFATLVLFLFLSFSEVVGADRVVDGLSIEGIYSQLNSRFYPFFEFVSDFSVFEYFFGRGLGDPFFIPWFEYRDGMDVYNANIDTMYLTIYSKFGMVSLLIGFFLVFPYPVKSMSRLDLALAVFLMVMFFVSATYYQIYSIGLFFLWRYLRSENVE